MNSCQIQQKFDQGKKGKYFEKSKHLVDYCYAGPTFKD